MGEVTARASALLLILRLPVSSQNHICHPVRYMHSQLKHYISRTLHSSDSNLLSVHCVRIFDSHSFAVATPTI